MTILSSITNFTLVHHSVLPTNLESVATRVGHTLQAQHTTELISEAQEPGKSTCVPESLSHFRRNRKTSTYKRRLSETKAEGW